MKAIINLFSKRDSWFHDIFSFRSPLMIPFAAKPLAYHLMDFCSNRQVEEVLLLDYRFDDAIAKEFNDCYQWYSKLTYMGSVNITNVRKLLAFHQDFCGDDDILILNGLFFIGGAPNQTEADWKENVQQIHNSLEPAEAQPNGSGIFFCQNHELHRVRLPQERPLESVMDYFNTNLSIIENDQHCSLPGYKSQKDIIFGATPIIKGTCSFNEFDEDEPPPTAKHTILLGNHVQIEDDCSIYGPAIIGNNVILEKDVYIERAIIFDNTYVSQGLEIIDKIIDRNTIIDPYTKAVTVQDDSTLTGDTRTHFSRFIRKRLYSLFNAVMAVALTVHLFICYFIFLCFFFVWSPRSQRWFFKFSLDKVPGVLKCLAGRKTLVGCFYQSPESAVFTYSESIQRPPDIDQWLLDNKYFLNHDSIMLRFSIIMKTLIIRIFQHDATRTYK